MGYRAAAWIREQRSGFRQRPRPPVGLSEPADPGALDGLLAEIVAEQRRGLPWVFERVAAIKARRPRLQRLRRRWATQDRKRDESAR